MFETFHRTRALSTSIHHFHSIVVILEAHVLNVRIPCCVSEIKNIGLLWAKVRRFCPKSTEVSIKEVRCFHFPEKPLSSSAPAHAPISQMGKTGNLIVNYRKYRHISVCMLHFIFIFAILIPSPQPFVLPHQRNSNWA